MFNPFHKGSFTIPKHLLTQIWLTIIFASQILPPRNLTILRQGDLMAYAQKDYQIGLSEPRQVKLVHLRSFLIRQVSCYALLRQCQLPWPRPCCQYEKTSSLGSIILSLGGLGYTFGSSHSASAAYQPWPTTHLVCPVINKAGFKPFTIVVQQRIPLSEVLRSQYASKWVSLAPIRPKKTTIKFKLRNCLK